jgi:hypothetical protein
MRSRYLFPLLLLMMITAPAFGQRMSPLFQILGSNALIDRPEEFRTMQADIDVELDSLKPGVRLDYLYQKSEQLRNAIAVLTASVGLTVDISDDRMINSQLRLQFGKNTISQSIPDSTVFSSTITALRLLAIDKVTELLDSALKVFSKQSFQDAAATALLNSLTDNGVTSQLSVPTGNVRKQLAARLVNVLIERATDLLKTRFYTAKPLNRIWVDISDDDRKAMKKEVESKFSEFVNDIRDKAINAVSVAENRIATVVSSYASTLISGTSGLAIKENGGDANGGVHFSFMLNPESQFGIFLNTQLNIPDTAQAGPLMAGIHYRHAIGQTQIDAFGSFIYGDSVLGRTAMAGEGGIGVSVATGKIVIGGAGIVLARGRSVSITLGAQLRRADRTSPAITIGFNWDTTTDRVRPIFQFGVPLVATNSED